MKYHSNLWVYLWRRSVKCGTRDAPSSSDIRNANSN